MHSILLPFRFRITYSLFLRTHSMTFVAVVLLPDFSSPLGPPPPCFFFSSFVFTWFVFKRSIIVFLAFFKCFVSAKGCKGWKHSTILGIKINTLQSPSKSTNSSCHLLGIGVNCSVTTQLWLSWRWYAVWWSAKQVLSSESLFLHLAYRHRSWTKELRNTKDKATPLTWTPRMATIDLHMRKSHAWRMEAITLTPMKHALGTWALLHWSSLGSLSRHPTVSMPEESSGQVQPLRLGWEDHNNPFWRSSWLRHPNLWNFLVRINC